VIVDLIGARRVAAMLERYDLPVPAVIVKAGADDKRLFAGGVLDYGRTFVG
jgi:hypothetical protein